MSVGSIGTLMGRPATLYDRLEMLKQHFLRELCEDQHEGSKFDCDVLDAINALQAKYPQKKSSVSRCSRRGE